jgi:cytochrome c55X
MSTLWRGIACRFCNRRGVERGSGTAMKAVIALALGSLCRLSLCAPLDDPELVSAWRTLRISDCARCHGKTYRGLSGPSIVEYARTQSREMFFQAVLDGNPGRGMPGYRGNAIVEPAMDGIYRYFEGRASGSIGGEDRPAPAR